MYVTNITDDSNIILFNCTTNDNNNTIIEIVIPLITIMCNVTYLFSIF